MSESAPPCFYFGARDRRAALDKAGRSVCRPCSARLTGTEYPLEIIEEVTPAERAARKEAERQGWRDCRASAEYKASARAYRQTPAYKERARERRRRNMADPAWRARHYEASRRCRAKAKARAAGHCT